MSAYLVARTLRLDGDVDLIAVAGAAGYLFAEHGFGMAGRGAAARIPVAQAATVLADIPTEDEVGLAGCGPVAFAALPFIADPTAEVVVPELVVGRTPDGARWVTTIGPVGAPTPPLTVIEPVPEAGWAADYTVRASRPSDEWCAAVVAARDAVRAGHLAKTVLARELVIEASRPFDVVGILSRLRSTFPSSYLYCVDGFLGATPELLVSRTGDVVRSHPLAGTAPRSGDPVVDTRLANALVASIKDQTEHRVTIDMVHDTLLPWCSYLDEEAEPSVVAVANVQHLGTLVEGRLSKPYPSVLELVAALHPTPAVGGYPRADALALIALLEGMDRGRYAGPVGWVDAAGNGRFAVGLRGADIDGNRARLCAGVGVVARSDPDAELAETQAKLAAMLGALIRP